MEYLFGALVSLGLGLLLLDWFRPPQQAEQSASSKLMNLADKRLSVDEQLLARGRRERLLKPLMQSLVSTIENRVLPTGSRDSVERKLAQAGKRHWAPGDFLGATILCAILTSVLVTYLTLQRMPVLTPLGFLGGLYIGYRLPLLVLSSSIKKRRKQMKLSLPDAIDLLSICIDAGLSFDQALRRTTDKLRGPLGEEFEFTLREIKSGFTRRDAMENLSRRAGVEDVQQFINAVMQAEEMGVTIKETMLEQAKIMREKRRQYAQAEAHKAPIKMTFPMVLFYIPALLLIVLGPAIIQAGQMFGMIPK